MKKYNITVNGNSYEVEVDEIGGAPSVVQAAPAPAAAPSPTPAAPAPSASAPKAAPAQTPSAGATEIFSPMPGTILDIKVAPGQAVAEDEVLLILEAMKMENEIVAPVAGTVDAIVVSKGTAVNAEDLLITIK